MRPDPLAELLPPLPPPDPTPQVGDDCDVYPLSNNCEFRLRGVVCDIVTIEGCKCAAFRADSDGWWVARIEKVRPRSDQGLGGKP